MAQPTRTALTFLLFALLPLAACKGARKGSEPAAGAAPWTVVQSTVWSLEEIEGKPLLAGTEAQLRFLSDGSLSGNGGVNNYRATYARNGEHGLSPSVVGSTRMYRDDPPGLMDQEGRYLELLGRVDAFDLRGGRLALFDEDLVVLEFAPLY